MSEHSGISAGIPRESRISNLATCAEDDELESEEGAAEEAEAGGATFGKLDSMTVAERKRYFGRQPTAADLLADAQEKARRKSASPSPTLGKPASDEHSVAIDCGGTDGQAPTLGYP